jgi:hypothetical protein
MRLLLKAKPNGDRRASTDLAVTKQSLASSSLPTGLGDLHSGAVVGRIQSTEGGDSLRDHCCHSSLVSDIAADGNRLVTGGDQFFYRRTNRIFVDVR